MTNKIVGYDRADSNIALSPVVVTTSGEVFTTDNLLTTRIDSASGTTYVGDAQPGSSSASAVWRIHRIVAAGSAVDILWSDGNTRFDNIWNNRASLSYS